MNIIDPQHPEGEYEDHHHRAEDGDQGNQLQLSRKQQMNIQVMKMITYTRTVKA